MPTRGLYGVIIDGELKVTVSPYDSYPSHLGVQMQQYLSSADIPKLKRAAKELVLITDWSSPPPQDVVETVRKRLENNSLPGDSWHNLLRPTFGDFKATLASGYILDAAEFGRDSLHCEWSWIVDLDKEVLEVYRGNQKEPHEGGRWSDVEEQRGGYYGIKLLQGYFLDAIPDAKAFTDTEIIDAGMEVS